MAELTKIILAAFAAMAIIGASASFGEDSEMTCDTATADPLVGKYFQSYDYVSPEQRAGGAEYVPSETGRIISRIQEGTYLLSFDDYDGDRVVASKNFYAWRFFDTATDIREAKSTPTPTSSPSSPGSGT